MNTTLIAVPQASTTLDVLALRYRAAFEKIKIGHEQWVEGTMDLVAVLMEVKRQPELASPTNYNRWLQQNGLQDITKNDRSALNCFARDLGYARSLLEASAPHTWEWVWRKRPRAEKMALPSLRKGHFSRTLPENASGSTHRKRHNTIPTVMREDYVPGKLAELAKFTSPEPVRRRRRRGLVEPRPERKAVNIKALTRDEVDPDFVGTPLEFATKYGHVTLQTKEEIEYHKHQEELMAWLGAVSDHDRTARVLSMLTVDPDTLRGWTRKSVAKNEKLKAWYASIRLAYEKLQQLVDGNETT